MTAARRVLVLLLAAGAVACHSPNTPSNSVVGSQPSSPSTGTAVSYYDQPVTLVVSNGVATGGVSPATTVEVATDSGFANIVTMQTPTLNAAGQLTVTLNHLSASTTYFWRVKTTAADSPSVTSAATSFTMGPPLVIQAPTPVTPLADTYPHKRPTFTVTNATRTGPAATLTYHFDVASDAAFSAIVASGTVAELSGQTSFASAVDLTPGATYYWRAQASDMTKNVVGPFSSAQSFTTVFPEDGTYRYELTVASPSWCLTNYTKSSGSLSGSGVCWDNGWVTHGLSYDGPLVVAGDSLQFTFPKANYDFLGPLAFTVTRAGNQLTGQVLGTTNANFQSNNGTSISSVNYKGTAVGQSDNQGRFSGTYDGFMEIWKYGFPCDSTSTCSTTGFTWTLTPH